MSRIIYGMGNNVIQKNRLDKIKIWYDRFGNYILGVLGFALIMYVLFYGPNTGLSDNADFGRVMKASSLAYIETDKAFLYVENYAVRFNGGSTAERIANLLFGTENIRYYPSIQLIFVRISVFLNVVFNYLRGSDPGVFRLSVLGSVYSVIYAVLLFALFTEIRLKKRMTDLISKILILVVLCDVGYLAYFNSFYGEAVQIPAYLLVAICLLRVFRKNRLSFRDILLTSFAVIVFGGSKFMNIPIAILLAAVFCFLTLSKANKKLALASGVSAVCILSAVYFHIPEWMDHETDYNAVFLGIVKDLDEEAAAMSLRELGLPPEMASLSGTGSYMSEIADKEENSHFKAAFNKISKQDILKFYLKHPSLFAEKLNISIRHGGFIRPYYLSNYDSGKPRFTLSDRFSFWSDLRAQMGFDTVLGNALVILALVAALIYLVRKGYAKKTHSLLILLLVAAALACNLAMPIVTNGEGDLAKHMFAYGQTIDYIFLFVVICALDSFRGGKLNFMTLTAFAMTAALCVSPLRSLISDGILKNKSHNRIEAGSYLALGKNEGKDMLWLVSDVTAGEATLMAAKPVCQMPFFDDGSKYGSNYWAQSTIRHWLNNDFLHYFTESERVLILESTHRFLLSGDYGKFAQSGERDFICTHLPPLADGGYDRAIGAQAADRVFLPDIRTISSLARRGFRIGKNIAYWLDTPYYKNGSMLRCAFPDGYIYFRDAKELCGVVPVIRVRADLPVKGMGSANSPFHIDGV